MNKEKIEVLEDLKLMETLSEVPLLIRHDDTIYLQEKLVEVMGQLGLKFNPKEQIHVDRFEELIKEKGIALSDMYTVKIRRKIVTRESLVTLK